MRNNHIRILCSVIKVDLVYEAADGTVIAFFDNGAESPLMQSPNLRRLMREGTEAQGGIFMRHNPDDCYFAGLHAGDGFLYMGPMAHQRLTAAKRRRMYRAYGIESEDLPVLPVFTLPEIRNMALLANTILENANLEEEELLQLNAIVNVGEEQLHRDQTAFGLKEEEADDVLQAVKEGRGEDAVRISEKMDRDSGRLSHSDLNHRRNMAIVGITLCSRAAIEGGISPAAAYRISGYYINKCDEAVDPAYLLHYRNRAIEDLAGRVREKLNKPRGSVYVRRCRDYIQKHYREKIYLEDIAEALELSPSYLSRLFKKETGICVQDAINEERIYRTSNLLLYSDFSLAEIANYVGFPNQSYMGKIFKKYKNMTPMAYRSTYSGQSSDI